MKTSNRIFEEAIRLDRSAFNFPTGLRAAVFIVTPVLLGVVLKNPGFIFACLGALFLTNTENPQYKTPIFIMLVACFTESAALGLGTLASIFKLLDPFFVGIFVFLVVILSDGPKWIRLGAFTGIVFAVGVGLPGGGMLETLPRAAFYLAGSLWGLAGVIVQRFVLSGKKSSAQSLIPNPPLAKPSERILRGFAIGLASAVGLTLGLVFGLPRDYWIIVSLILIMRVSMVSDEAVLSMFLGTVVGAVIAAAVTLEISNLYFLSGILFIFALLAFTSRGVNLGLVQIFFVPFLIVLLNLAAPGHWELAFVRILDVGIGGTLGIVTAYLLKVVKSNFKI
jgi:hypothetical protein